jgi:spore maturation protein CgeB
MYSALSTAQICVNVHIDTSGNMAGNMRMFEATGMGCCLLTDYKENLRELFEPDREVITFRSATECAGKLSYLLDHPIECAKIAHAGQQRTLRDHRLDAQILRMADTLLTLAS